MIQVKDLHFTYGGNAEQTIKGIDFEIKKGEVFGFLGPSGAGKSTTQKIIIGILKGFSGTVKVMNTSLLIYGKEYYEKIGVALFKSYQNSSNSNVSLFLQLKN